MEALITKFDGVNESTLQLYNIFLYSQYYYYYGSEDLRHLCRYPCLFLNTFGYKQVGLLCISLSRGRHEKPISQQGPFPLILFRN